MLRINLSKQALKFMRLIPVKHSRQIEKILTILKANPFPQDTKHLKGTSDHYRVDSGEYRIIYQVDKIAELLIIVLIGKRNDSEIYKQFRRKR